MLTIVVAVLSGILVLGVLILIHELGHYLAARHVGVRVERFSIGFPPKAIGKRIGETEYVLSWTPIGGYVKLYGQNIDDENPSDPRNYAAKSKLQRAYILLAGPAMNLLGAVLLMTLVYMLGVETPSFRLSQPHIAQVAEDSPAQRAGFQPGDQIVRLGETEITSWNDLDDAIEQAVIHGQVLRFTVQRQGREHALTVGHLPFASGKDFGWRPVIPAVVGGFGDDSPARAAGMEMGDRIVAIDGKPVQSFGEVRGAIQRAQGQPLAIRVERAGAELTFTGTPRSDEPLQRWLIGIAAGTYLERHGLPNAFLLGSERLVSMTQGTFLFLGRCLSLNCSAAGLAGPVRIVELSGRAARRGPVPLLEFMALISMALAIVNLLPIPALDGGHIFMLGVEALNRGPLSPRVRERTQMVGMSLLLLLFVFVIYNDVVQVFSLGGGG